MAAAKHILVALVTDKPGVLNRMASMFRRRGFNIDSIAVGRTELPNLSRMTIVVDGTNTSVEQVRKQLEKIVDVVRVSDISGDSTITRELALIKVKASSSSRSEIIEIVDIFRASIVDVSSDSVTIEVTGDDEKISSLFTLLRGFGIREVARTGRIAMVRGELGPLAMEAKSARAKRQK
jgi:acetolactate synthase-1/3 small subunit